MNFARKLVAPVFMLVCSAFFLLNTAFNSHAQSMNEYEFKTLVQQNFKEHNYMVMDVLHSQPVEVLDIAMSGGSSERKPGLVAQVDSTGPKSIAMQSNAQGASPTPLFIESEFKTMLQKVLRENPDLVMDVLRQNPVEVLDIAQLGNEEKKKPQLLAQWKEDVKKPKVIKLENRPMRGAPNAPVLIVAFSDFSCPHCARASQVIDDALVNYPTKVKFVFKHRPLKSHQYSRIAAQYFIAASMQSDIKAWALYHGLYEGRDELITKGEDFIKPLAQRVGLDMEKLSADLNSEQVTKILEEDMQEATEFGFDGAPYLLLNNLVLAGAPSPNIMEYGIDEAMRLK